MDVFKFCFLGRMGVFLDKLKIDKYNEGGVGNILRYGFSSMQGWRVEMEDVYIVILGLLYGLKQWFFFVVFDGYVGVKVLVICVEQLLQEIVFNDDFKGKLELKEGIEI